MKTNFICLGGSQLRMSSVTDVGKWSRSKLPGNLTQNRYMSKIKIFENIIKIQEEEANVPLVVIFIILFLRGSGFYLSGGLRRGASLTARNLLNFMRFFDQFGNLMAPLLE